MEIKEINIKEETANFNAAMLQFGMGDIDIAIKTALECEKNGDWVADEVNQYCDNVGVSVKDVDIVYIVFEALHQEARNEIIEATGTDILNDLDQTIEVAGNYMCSMFDGTEKAAKDTLKFALKVEDKSKTLTWFIEKLKEM